VRSADRCVAPGSVTPLTRNVVTDCAGTVMVAFVPVTRTGVPRTSLPLAAVTTGVTVALLMSNPDRSSVTVSPVAAGLACTTVAPVGDTAAMLRVLSVFTR
jgi:hypothetical protein